MEYRTGRERNMQKENHNGFGVDARLNNVFNASKKRRKRMTHIYVSFSLFFYSPCQKNEVDNVKGIACVTHSLVVFSVCQIQSFSYCTVIVSVESEENI